MWYFPNFQSDLAHRFLMTSADPITQREVLNQVKKHKTICANIKSNYLMQENQGVGKGIESVQFQSITVSVFSYKATKRNQ